ncbi:hypothetical protein [Microseira wollei]|uniref:hypothetical protein n=1 Tax=Microseira wollei TaxID=467598 RepID=UPI001CFCABA8|nr:hypothetical protein [Microseira wollei]
MSVSFGSGRDLRRKNLETGFLGSGWVSGSPVSLNPPHLTDAVTLVTLLTQRSFSMSN